MKKANLIRSVIFILLAAFLLWGANRVMTPSHGKGNGYEFMPEGTVDVVICGASSVGVAVSPCILWEEQGIASINTFNSAQPALCTYYCLRDTLEYQKPKLVVLDASVLWYDYTVDSSYFEPCVRTSIDRLRMSPIKREAIRDIVSQSDIQSAASYYFPLIRFHERWSGIKSEDIRSLLSTRSDGAYDELLGQKLLTGRKTQESVLPIDMAVSSGDAAAVSGSDAEQTGVDAAGMPPQSRKYYEKIFDLCEEEGIRVLLLKTPLTTWTPAKHEATAALAAQHACVDFLDYNTAERLEALALDSSRDLFDQVHLNIYGMQKLSPDLARYLAEHYDLEDHRGDERYSIYDSSLEKYHRTLAAAEINGSDNTGLPESSLPSF